MKTPDLLQISLTGSQVLSRNAENLSTAALDLISPAPVRPGALSTVASDTART